MSVWIIAGCLNAQCSDPLCIWASCNLGAEKPEEFGDYYAWGETKPKNSYSFNNYTYYDANTTQYIDIGKDISGTEYDAATVNLGSDWRMPTKQEMEELINNCTWEWIQIGNINGYKITGKNGNSIFLPAAGNNYSDKNFKLLYYTSTCKSTEWIHYFFGVTEKISASFLGGAISSINGKISSGSSFNVKFSNNSTESVTLTQIQLNDAQTGSEGNNMLSEEVDVPAGTDKSYTVTVGVNGI